MPLNNVEEPLDIISKNKNIQFSQSVSPDPIEEYAQRVTCIPYYPVEIDTSLRWQIGLYSGDFANNNAFIPTNLLPFFS